jgi:hypothetical protein
LFAAENERDNIRWLAAAPESVECCKSSLPVDDRKGARMRDSSTRRDSSSGPKVATETTERRGTARMQFTATAEIIELVSGARFSTRTTDLGPGGCFVDTMLPFPVGSCVRIALQKGKAKFETGGSVVYSQTGLGMGIAFSDLNPEQQAELETWLEEVAGDKRVVLENSVAPRKEGPVRSPDHTTLVRMIHLLIHKGILTEAEGAALLHDPVL